MNYYVIALRDIKANNHEPPMFVPNINAAMRDLADLINDQAGKVTWQRHPEDFELYQLGTWDSETAEFTITKPQQLLLLSALKP